MSLLYKWYQQPLYWISLIFISFMFSKGVLIAFAPEYRALVEYTGGGWPAVVEMYESLKLAIVLWGN